MADHPTDQLSDMRGHREVSLPITYVNICRYTRIFILLWKLLLTSPNNPRRRYRAACVTGGHMDLPGRGMLEKE